MNWGLLGHQSIVWSLRAGICAGAAPMYPSGISVITTGYHKEGFLKWYRHFWRYCFLISFSGLHFVVVVGSGKWDKIKVGSLLQFRIVRILSPFQFMYWIPTRCWLVAGCRGCSTHLDYTLISGRTFLCLDHSIFQEGLDWLGQWLLGTLLWNAPWRFLNTH